MRRPRPRTRSLGTLISLGFGIVLLLHGGIAVLNHVGLDRAERDFRRYDEMKHRAAGVVDLDRELEALQHHVLMYTQTGHPGPARRVRQMYEKVCDRLDGQIESAAYENDLADLQEVRVRLDAYLELFEEVVIDRDRWTHLSDEGLHRLSVEVEGRLATLADAEVAAGDYEAASQLNLARQRLLLAESAAVQYLLRPEIVAGHQHAVAPQGVPRGAPAAARSSRHRVRVNGGRARRPARGAGSVRKPLPGDGAVHPRVPAPDQRGDAR